MVRYLIAIFLVLKMGVASASVPPLYQSIAHQWEVPPTVLYALAMGESQTRLKNGLVRPWPWTLNVKGTPYYYADKETACQALMSFLRQTEIVDIGLTQHNWRWQKDHFTSPCSVFEPSVNLAHAARLLREGRALHGDWVKAAGYFHRPAGGQIAQRYEKRFVAQLTQVQR
ncbi:hypothetical protein VII00023_06177 [Vibrio ichthyoenteri ATCC 700023]|uniref:Transglycosylase SLT domain-containing protein n=1 Tax=Vibrio ichthyoenteri ATCC 700023 TaxID=870968 RepID=F9S1V4_9VIBR|nr:hypothetical protein [Vibrio ichthyoenteri]EGU41194.1 hypothetical protein VII00023_06177 [Vibrio ichthyoenteri ATCC 700023]